MILASDWIAHHADRTPDKLAMVDQTTGRRFTYGDFHQRVGALAAFLRDEWNIGFGDTVAILGKNSSDYFEFQFACFRLGAIMLPLNWRLAEPELLFILNDAKPKGLVYDGEFASRVPPLMAGSPLQCCMRVDVGQLPADENLAYETALLHTGSPIEMSPSITHDTCGTIMYTAGTTGNPKGVIITQGMTFWNAINISGPTGLNCHSVYYVLLPTFHTGGLNLYANPIFHWGGTNIIAREFDAGLTLKMIADREVGLTHFFGVPSIYLFMSQHQDFESTELAHIDSWGCGGAALPVPVLETYARRGAIIQAGFGMTETSPTVFLMAKRLSLQKPTSVGKPMLHTRVRVVDDHFKDVPPGTVGEVVIGGPNITPGYLNRPDANADSFTTDDYGERWVHSGDAGTIDEDGCIYIVDRYKDMYISCGENVYPAEVEKVIFQIPQVADVGVIGVSDERWGETGMAIIVLKAGQELTDESVFEHCRKNLAKYKVPKYVAYTDALPRNAAGKVLKRELREKYGKQEKK
ncbi:MAG: long-chain fatty acid--CoA ligase [Anaerolineae bacterium]|nr:long-chain fatty acid--CoA ligase [Anaerolineae bacterium]